LAVEFGQERGERGAQHRIEAAASVEHAAGAVGRLQVWLGQPHDLSNGDLISRPAEHEAAAPAALGGQKAGIRQFVHHFHDVVLRYAVARCHVGDGQPLARRDGSLEENAQGVVGVAGQADGFPPGDLMQINCMFWRPL
jgi:hypothetical protein